MKEINKGIVFSEDIKKIFNGDNAFGYRYSVVPSDSVIKEVRRDFGEDVNKIFDNNVVIVSEEEMAMVNYFIGGEYPHCIFG